MNLAGILDDYPQRAYALIIVEHQEGYWNASFVDLPQYKYGAPEPLNAIRRLINAEDLRIDDVIPIDDSTREGHLEFRVQHRERLWIPDFSEN